MLRQTEVSRESSDKVWTKLFASRLPAGVSSRKKMNVLSVVLAPFPQDTRKNPAARANSLARASFVKTNLCARLLGAHI